MALTVLTLSCLLFYATSRYFPVDSTLQSTIAKYRSTLMITSTVLLVVSLVGFYQIYQGLTAFIVWLTAGMTILSALILTVKLNPRWLYGWGILCLLFLIVDLA